MRWRWPWRCPDHSTAEEAQAALVELEQRDAQVAHLARQLRKAQIQNHFSAAVNEAIARTQERR